jgi:S-adenosylhomocysteine hydrolase
LAEEKFHLAENEMPALMALRDKYMMNSLLLVQK